MLSNEALAPSIKPGKWLSDFVLLTAMQILLIRGAWFWTFVLGTAFPLTLLFFLMFYSVGMSQRSLIYVLMGNITYALTINGMLAVGQELGWQKESHAFEYYATLPLAKQTVVLAILTRSVLFAFPSVAIILLVSRLIFDLSFPFHLLLIPLLILASYSLVGFGALIGLYSPTHRVANQATQFLALIIAYLSPLMVPIENLPKVLQWTSLVLPTTYVARALRTVVITGWSPTVGFDLALLGGFTLLSLVLIQYKFDWRVE